LLSNNVIGGEKPDNRVGVAELQNVGRQADRGSRVFGRWLHKNVPGGKVGELCAHGVVVRATGNHKDSFHRGKRFKAFNGVDQERLTGTQKIQQKLWLLGP
jgi:hypothetical protein